MIVYIVNNKQSMAKETIPTLFNYRSFADLSLFAMVSDHSQASMSLPALFQLYFIYLLVNVNNMNKPKKQTIQTSLSNVIQSHKNSEMNFREKTVVDLNKYITSNSPNTPLHIHDRKQAKKRLKFQQPEKQLLDRLRQYECLYYRLFQQQVQKYKSYYSNMITIIRGEEERGLSYLEDQRRVIHDMFRGHQDTIKSISKQIQNSQRGQNIDFSQKLHLLTNLVTLEIRVVEVMMPDLTTFRCDIEKYIIQCYDKMQSILQTPKNNSIEMGSQQCNSKDNDDNISPEKVSRSTQTEQEQVYSNRFSQCDDLLSCDEELGRRISPTSMKRRKYDVGRQNVIKEEDESDETNSIVSDC